MTKVAAAEACEFCGSTKCADLAACAERYLEKAATAEAKLRSARRAVWAHRFKLGGKVLAALGTAGLLAAGWGACDRAEAERFRKARENWNSWSAAFLGDRKAACAEGKVRRYGPDDDEAYSCIVGHGHDNKRVVCYPEGCQAQ